MNEEYRKIIDESSGMEEWNMLTPIFGFPILILWFVFAGIFLPTFGKTVSQSGEPLSVAVTPIEYNLEISGNVWVVISIMTWVMYFLAFIKSKRNKIQAYSWNQIGLMLISLPTFYSIFYGFQFFVPFLVIRLVYWLLFLAAIIYIIIIIISKRIINLPSFTSNQKEYFMRILILLWVISALANFFVGGLNHIFARILLAIIPIFPPFIILAFVYVYSQCLSKLFILRDINTNQEYYRQELGYSLENWYGKKSRAYLEVVGQVKPSFIRTPLFRHTIEIIISLVLLVVIGSVNVNNDSPSLWVIFSIILIVVIFPIDYIISLIKWLIMKIKSK